MELELKHLIYSEKESYSLFPPPFLPFCLLWDYRWIFIIINIIFLIYSNHK
jgi:hypothetical protein